MLKIIILFVLFNISLSCNIYQCNIKNIQTENEIKGNINIGDYICLNYNFDKFKIGNKVCIKQNLKETDMNECPTNSLLYCEEKWLEIINRDPDPIQNENMCVNDEKYYICTKYILNDNQ
jgi:hypothetical protein